MLDSIVNDNYLSSGDRVAVGVSGGADSMVLLFALLEKQKKIDFYLKVIHVNHHLRGAESDRDSEFVKNFCEEHNVDCAILDVDVNVYKSSNKKTIEESARNLRYNAIFNEMKRCKLNKLFLAHHMGDQVETILMHILRGSGIRGAVGISDSDVIKHPLLGLTKAEILDIANKNNISFVQDSTNSDNSLTRNYIRNVVIPNIEKIYGSAVQNICEFGKKCSEVQDYLVSQIDENKIIKTADSVTLLSSIFSEPMPLVREYILFALNYLKIYFDVEAKHYDLIVKFAESQTGKSINLPHGAVAKRVYDGIKFYLKKNSNGKNVEFEFKVGKTKIAGFGTIEVLLVEKSEVKFKQGEFYADLNKIPTTAVWRTKRQGDKFKKFGGGTKLLSDYFTDKKIDSEQRDNIPLLVAEGKVLFVAGFDISEYIKIDESTKTVVKFNFIKTNP